MADPDNFPRMLFGKPIKDQNWHCDNGENFDPDSIIPVVETVSNQVIGIQDDGTALVIKSFDTDTRPLGAHNFSKVIWGRQECWPKPDERIVECLGDACCGEVTMDFATNWVIEPPEEDGVLRATYLPKVNEEHLLYVSYYPPGEIQDTDLLLRQIELFGVPYDNSARIVYPPFQKIYSMPQPEVPIESQEFEDLS